MTDLFGNERGDTHSMGRWWVDRRSGINIIDFAPERGYCNPTRRGTYFLVSNSSGSAAPASSGSLKWKQLIVFLPPRSIWFWTATWLARVVWFYVSNPTHGAPEAVSLIAALCRGPRPLWCADTREEPRCFVAANLVADSAAVKICFINLVF